MNPIPARPEMAVDPSPDYLGFCIILGWLPEEVARQDWATLLELQERLKKQNEDTQMGAWANQVRQSFN